MNGNLRQHNYPVGVSGGDNCGEVCEGFRIRQRLGTGVSALERIRVMVEVSETGVKRFVQGHAGPAYLGLGVEASCVENYFV